MPIFEIDEARRQSDFHGPRTIGAHALIVQDLVVRQARGLVLTSRGVWLRATDSEPVASFVRGLVTKAALAVEAAPARRAKAR